MEPVRDGISIGSQAHVLGPIAQNQHPRGLADVVDQDAADTDVQLPVRVGLAEIHGTAVLEHESGAAVGAVGGTGRQVVRADPVTEIVVTPSARDDQPSLLRSTRAPQRESALALPLSRHAPAPDWIAAGGSFPRL